MIQRSSFLHLILKEFMVRLSHSRLILPFKIERRLLSIVFFLFFPSGNLPATNGG